MKTQLEFRSQAFPPLPGEEQQINPGRYGRRLVDFIAAELPRFGFEVQSIGNEDWGWMVELKNEAFPLWIGCGNLDETEDGFLCFIEPAKPYLRRWFKKIDTTARVSALALALETLLFESGKVSDLVWWSEGAAPR